MDSKLKEKDNAIELRKRGLSYSEILEEIPVAKSTLSLWLRSVGLAERHRQRLTKKKLAAALRGAIRKKLQRLNSTEKIQNKAQRDIGRISRRELWLIGVALYWAEGSKQKEHSVSQGVKLVNSDSRIIKIFLKWLLQICKIPRDNIHFRLSIHRTAQNRLEKIQKYWSNITGFKINNFQKIDWKKHKVHTNRKNLEEKYFGLLNIYVRKSTNFNREIAGWIKGICKQCGVV